MNIADWIQNPLQESGGVFFVEVRPFEYSDGDQAEQYVAAVIGSARDLSSDSTELEKAIKDWPSRYHLSRERTNGYRSLAFPADATVLEIGSGCGAITRYLAENVATVVALEGSARRAAITRSRTRDCANVQVVCGSFESVQFTHRFDYVVCNGVLEYAPLFVNHPDPVARFLELLSALVTPAGSILIAIENKVGLRYFSSSKEDHTGILFDGVEGYARFPNGPKTFGNQELRQKLLQCFSVVDLLLPLPDYKFPAAIIRDSLTETVDCAELFASLDTYNYGVAKAPLFHERLVWGALQQTGLLAQFSNSFFFIAGNQKTDLMDDRWLGDIYSGGRKSAYTTRTRIMQGEQGRIETVKKRITADKALESSFLSHAELSSEWINGPSIHTLITRALVQINRPLPMQQRIQYPIQLWWRVIQHQMDDQGLLPGGAMDATWQNVIVDQDMGCLFDQEWVSRERLAVLFLIYRSVICFVSKEIHFIDRWAPRARWYTQFGLIRCVAEITGTPFSMAGLMAAIRLDSEFILASRGHQYSAISGFLRLFVPLNLLKFKSEAFSWGRSISSRIVNRLARLF